MNEFKQPVATSKPSQATQTSEFNARFVPFVVFRVKSRFALTMVGTANKFMSFRLRILGGFAGGLR